MCENTQQAGIDPRVYAEGSLANVPRIYEIHVVGHNRMREVHGPYSAEEVIAVQMKLGQMIGYSHEIVKRCGRQVY